MNWWTPLVVATLLLSAAAPGLAAVVEDAGGDVRIGVYDNPNQSPAGWEAVDLLAIDITEDADHFYWTVQVTALAEDRGGQCPDSGDLRSFFRYGEAVYNVQQGLDPASCAPYGLLWETFGTDFNRRPIGTLNATATTTDSVTVDIPKDLILDDGGTPPIAGRALTDIRARSFNMASLGGPDLTNPFSQEQKDWLVVADDMPDDAAAAGTYTIQQGGMDSNGPVRVWSEDPFRSSNGGDAVYVYEVQLTNDDATARTYDIALLDIPAAWKHAAPSAITVAAGTTAAFDVAVETPFGHQHGGSDVFRVRVADVDAPMDAWAVADLGVHYLAVPQPAGHHPELWLHAVPLDPTFTPIFAGGDGLFAMNTVQEGASDGQPIQGFYDSNDGNVVAWISCLQDGLRMGLDWDLTRTGSFAANLATTKPYPGSTLHGRLIHLGSGPALQFCAPPFYGDRTITELATLAPVDLGDWQGDAAVTATVTPLVDRVPYQRGGTLVLELWVEHGLVNVAGPSTATLAPGAKLDLPLNEYYDERPAGLIGGGEAAPEATAAVQAALNGTADTAEADGDEGAPGPAIVAVLGVLAAAARTGRRHRN